MTRPSKSKAIERLKKALSQMRELKELATESPQFKKWRISTKNAIANTYGEKDPHVEEFTSISYTPWIPGAMVVGGGGASLPRAKPDYRARYQRGLTDAGVLLEAMIEQIVEYWEDESPAQFSASSSRDELINTTKVFLVHGRDLGTRDSVARFLETLKLQPVILDEQADRGQTIIEKFEQHAQEVRFAVVLLTPDDEGRIRGEESDLKPRARQNVIFELGYFARSFGRNRVCALTKGGVEIPSDYDGVVYIPLDDSGGWKMRLIKELKAAEFDVDANLAY